MAKAEPTKTNKRSLRAPSQTMREQAEQAQTDADKPSRSRHLRAAAATGRRPFTRLAKSLDRQPFRAIGKVLKLIGRVLVPSFIRNAFAELRLVTWPTRKETRQLTVAVLLFAAVFGAAITAVDYGLDKLFRAVILK